LYLSQEVAENSRQLQNANEELLESRALLVSQRESHADLPTFSEVPGAPNPRAPLPHVAGMIEILERDFQVALDSRSKTYLSSIASAAKEMENLIDDLSTFSRMNKAKIKKTPINLRSLAQDVIDQLDPGDSRPATKWILGELPCVHADAE